MIAAVVAVDEKNGIGKDGGMLVSIPGDLKMFRGLTSGHVVIMGRRTFDALPCGPLPDRINVVISSQAQGMGGAVKDKNGKEYYLASLAAVKSWLSSQAKACKRHVFVIGGGVIYKELLPWCTRVYLTRIGKTFDGADTWFPDIQSSAEWQCNSCGEMQHFGEIPYQFCVYERISFWDSSWEKADVNRIAQYAERFDMKSDDVIDCLHLHGVRSVCDAGCGCGIYTLKLVKHGFSVSGFDVAAAAVATAQKLIQEAGCAATLKTASILATGYADKQFDAVISRDVLDHLCKTDAMLAVKELYRIVCPGGIVIFTLDHLDDEYAKEQHVINDEGDFVFTTGKWQGMVFHPYSVEEIRSMLPSEAICEVTDEDEITVKMIKA